MIARALAGASATHTVVTAEAHYQTPAFIASLIDHTLLKPEATEADVARLCREAAHFRFASVCINPYWVKFARESLAESGVAVCTVIGFPLGANELATKIREAEQVLSHGASELDMVQNVGALRSGKIDAVRDEFIALADLAHSHNARLKIILETSLLSTAEKLESCTLAREAGADFVKTSTGFSGSGATVEDVSTMRQAVGTDLGVKASGGISSLAVLQNMVRAGASRIGTSSGVAILRELTATGTSGEAPIEWPSPPSDSRRETY